MNLISKPMDRDISCINLRAIINYVSNKLGKGSVDSLLAGLIGNKEFLIEDKYEPGKIVPVTLDHLRDPDYWVSNDFSIRVFQKAANMLPGQRPLYRAGIEAVMDQFSLKRTAILAKILPVQVALSRVAKENRKYNRTKTVKMVHRGRGRAVFELQYRPEVKVSKNICEWNLGIYMGYGIIAGGKNVRVMETSCATEGGRICIFEILWDYIAFWKRIKGFFLYLLEKDFFNAYERERLDKEDLVFNLEQKIEQRTMALKESEEKFKSLALSLEKQVEQRTKELKRRLDELEKFYKTTVGRELKMAELKKEIKRLKNKN